MANRITGKRPLNPDGFDASRFLSVENERRYTAKFEPKKVIPEKAINLASFPENHPIRETVRRRKWETLVTFAENSPSTILKEFCANVDTETVDSTRKSWVRGKVVRFDAATIEAFLNTSYDSTTSCKFIDLFNRMQPASGRYRYRDEMPEIADKVRRGISGLYTNWIYKAEVDHVPDKLVKSDLQGETLFWHHFVNSTVIASSNQTDVNMERAILYYVLMQDKRLNIANILSDRIVYITTKTSERTRLAHPALIMHLCMRAGVEVPDSEIRDIKPGSIMTLKNYQDYVRTAHQDQLLRAAKISPDIQYLRSPRYCLRAPSELHPEHLLPERPAPAGPAYGPAAPLYEDSPVILQMQQQLAHLTTQGNYWTVMLEGICSRVGFGYEPHRPQQFQPEPQPQYYQPEPQPQYYQPDPYQAPADVTFPPEFFQDPSYSGYAGEADQGVEGEEDQDDEEEESSEEE